MQYKFMGLFHNNTIHIYVLKKPTGPIAIKRIGANF